MTGGVSYVVLADQVLVADTGVIKMVKGTGNDQTIIAALPHGASVIQEEQIVKPEKSAIHKLD